MSVWFAPGVFLRLPETNNKKLGLDARVAQQS